jgi:hypothetical protein
MILFSLKKNNNKTLFKKIENVESIAKQLNNFNNANQGKGLDFFKSSRF